LTIRKTIAERNLTTIQLSKETVQRLRQAESYPRETYGRIVARLLESQMAMATKLKELEAYPHEPYLSIVGRLVKEHDNRIAKEEQGKTVEKARENRCGSANAAEAFQKEISKITGKQ
jgi:hypothetical protein